MKESYRENLASCSGLEPYAGDGNIAGVASARGNAGQPLSSGKKREEKEGRNLFFLRTARVTPGGMVFHVLNRGVGRMRLFNKDRDYEAFE